MFLTKPLAGLQKWFVQIPHNEVNGAAMGVTDIALVAVAATVEGEAGMLVRMERAQGFMVAHLEPQGLSDLLDRQVLKLMNIETVHHIRSILDTGTCPFPLSNDWLSTERPGHGRGWLLAVLG